MFDLTKCLRGGASGRVWSWRIPLAPIPEEREKRTGDNIGMHIDYRSFIDLNGDLHV